MSRIRTIKPEFFSSEDIVSMSPLARLFYVSLWCESDREGRMDWKPRTFKIRYFAADTVDVDELANELIDRELIVIYEVDGKKYAEIPTFKEHQVINNREAESLIPSRVKVASARVLGEGRKEGKGREGKGKEGIDTPDGVSDSVFQDFKKLRAAKKSPITETALDGIRREADKAGVTLESALSMCCERGWTGFEADWVADTGGNQAKSRFTPPQPNETVPSKQGVDPALAKIIADGLRTGPPPKELRAKLFGKQVQNEL